MYLDPIVFHALFALGALPALAMFALGVIVARGRTVGGLTFCKAGPIGFSFYLRNR